MKNVYGYIARQAARYAMRKGAYELGRYGRRKFDKWVEDKFSPKRTSNYPTPPSSGKRKVATEHKKVPKKMKVKRNLFSKKIYKYNTLGRYRGSFNQVTKKSGRGLADYNRKGIVTIVEQTGSFSDPDCIYLLNDVLPGKMLIQTIVKSLLRHLFEKCNVPVNGVEDVLEKETLGTGVGNLQVRLTKFNYSTGVSSVSFYNLTPTSTLDAVAYNFYNDFYWFSSGDNWNSNASQEDLISFILCEVTPTDDMANVRGELKLDQVEVDVFGKSTVKVQNRTRAANGSTDAEDVNNNPLQGRCYLFKGLPKMKSFNKVGSVEGNSPFETVEVDKGVRQFSAPFTDFKEPPPPTMFWNCVASSKVKLEPGDIKKFDMMEQKKMFVKRLLQKMRLQNGAAASEYRTSYSIFKSQLIALEDVINVNLEEPIGIAWEIERVLAVKCSSKRNSFCRTQYQQLAY